LAKALGSGHEGGFGLRPSASRQGLFALFADEACADEFVHRSPVVSAYRERSADFLLVKLRATSSRGAWAGATITPSIGTPSEGAVAALTRASIRPRSALNFWRHSPLSERALVAASGCRLAVGLGEAPLLRQATFSIWDSQAAMDAYARSGPHLDAIRAAQTGAWFSESMFVRFVPSWLQGQWQGQAYG
jgi:spheroidene monooxygenase